MSVQPLREESDRNPRTAEEAKALVKRVESLFMPWNIDALVGGFTDDCVVRFGTVPEFRGREALPAFQMCHIIRNGVRRPFREIARVDAKLGAHPSVQRRLALKITYFNNHQGYSLPS